MHNKRFNYTEFHRIQEAIKRISEKQIYTFYNTINLIASESYTIHTLTKKEQIGFNTYSEGFDSNWFYQGCTEIIKLEWLAQSLSKTLFNFNFVNVQPHSGSQANQAIMFALLNIGDTVLSLDTWSGSHLTHGMKINFSGRLYNIIWYPLNRYFNIDFDQVEWLTKRHKPKLIICGFTSYMKQVNFKKFSQIAKKYNAYVLADTSHISGLIISGLHPHPKGYVDVLMTTMHKNLRGPKGAIIMTDQEDLFKRINQAVFPGIQGGPINTAILQKTYTLNYLLKEDLYSFYNHSLNCMKWMLERFKDYNVRPVYTPDIYNVIFDTQKYYKINGNVAALWLEKFQIIVNKNYIPNDTKSAHITSGIRIGTIKITQKNYDRRACWLLVDIIHRILNSTHDKIDVHKVKKDVIFLQKNYHFNPFYYI